MRSMKEQARKVYPRYVFGYNFIDCGMKQLLNDIPRECIELCAGGGHIMDEYAKSCADSGHPYRRWEDWARLMVTQSEQVRRLGGHLFPIIHSQGPVGTYQNIFTLAAGGHPYYGGQTMYNKFATRYSSVLWHEDIRNVWNPNGLVLIRPGVMWEEYVREQQIDSGRKRLIIHLINPPAQETATESDAAAGELKRREKLEKAELDKLPPVRLYPDPQRDILVRVVPQAMKNEWDITKALLLDSETCSHQEIPIDRSDRYFWQMTVPELKFWKILVVELKKK